MESNEPIKNKFLYFKTQAAFDDALTNGNITKDHIVVIQQDTNTASLYMHGKWINGINLPASTNYYNLATALYEVGVGKERVWS